MRHSRKKSDGGGRIYDEQDLRSTGSMSRSWIDGTMEVISGLAPRPSTPQRQQQQQQQSHQRTRSAPNSPAGPRSYPGIQRAPSHEMGIPSIHRAPSHEGIHRAPSYDYPGISRVPSADAMERSMHNDSGHGKSTAQIIRDLKASNAHFSAKTAEMEAEFMNEINRVTRSFEEKNRALQESLKSKTLQVSSLESRCTAAEQKIRERDTQMSKLKEEAAYQRHTISEYKRELSDLKNSQYDAPQQWESEKQELENQVKRLQSQIQALTEGGGEGGGELLQNWKQLEESQQALSISTKRLYETQSALATAEKDSRQSQKEHARAIEQHGQEIARLKREHQQAQAEWSRQEMEMHTRMEKLESDQNPVIKELKAQLKECDTTIASLRDQVEASRQATSELEEKLEKSKADSKSREAYRREEAEDLRVMLDAQADEIDHLKEDLEEMQREVFTKEDDLVEAEKELEEQMERYEQVLLELNVLKEQGVSGNGSNSEELSEVRESLRQAEEQLEATNRKHDEMARQLRGEIGVLVTERDGLESRLQVTEKERDQALEELDRTNRARVLEVESQSTEQLEELRTQLEKEYEEKLSKVTSSNEEEIAALERKVADIEADLQKAGESKVKVEELQSQLDAANKSLEKKTQEISVLESKVRDLDDAASIARTRSIESDAATVEELAKLKETVKKLEEENKVVLKTKKQLRDAQIALVALDNDRKKLTMAYREKTEELEHEKEEAGRKSAATEEATSRINELTDQVETLKKELKEKDAEIASAATNGHNAREADLEKDISSLRDEQTRLTTELATVKREKEEQERRMKDKLADRDTTISALVKASVTQDQKLRSLRAEVKSLTEKLEVAESTSSDRGAGTTQASRDVTREDDIERLRSSLHDYREIEKKLTAELTNCKKNLFSTEIEVQRLRDEMEDSRSVYTRGNDDQYRQQIASLRQEIDAMAADHQDKIQERDSAIATLVKQSMAQEANVSALEAQLASLKSGGASVSSDRKDTSPSWDEVRRLQKESEIFAGQIIEQDEEMEGLKGELEGCQAQIETLKNELSAAKARTGKADPGEIIRLRAELDEVQEANQTQLEELRDLRRELRQSKVNADEIVDLKIELAQAQRALEEYGERVVVTERDDPTMRLELDDALAAKKSAEDSFRTSQATIRSMETKLKEREDTIARLKTESQQYETLVASLRNDLSKSKNDEELAILQSEVDTLREELRAQSARTEEAQNATRELQDSIGERSSSEAAKIEALERENIELQNQLKTLEDDRAHIQELKERLARAEEDRESVEKSIVDSYERKMSLMKLNKDITIDGLRKDLAEAKGRNSGDMDELMKRVRELEMENKDLNDEMDTKLDQKTAKIYALEQTLNAQEQLVENMRAEMDQLQSSMERSTQNRRAEIDEMQQEVLDKSARMTRQEREIVALKMELEETKVAQETKVARLQERIASMESSPMARSIAEQHVDHRLNDVKERLEQMSWRNTSLEQENANLRNRLDKAESSSKAVEDEMDKVATMEEEISYLQGRVKELETERALKELEKEVTEASTTKSVPRPSTSKPPASTTRTTTPASPRKKNVPSSPGKQKSGRLNFLKRRGGSTRDVGAD